MTRVIELGEYSDHAYAAIFPGLGLLLTDPEGVITLYRDDDKGPGFIVHKANSPITALACTHNIILISCGETLRVSRYRPDLGKFDELSDTTNECTLPHAVSVLYILDSHGFLAGTDVGECYLFPVNLDDEVEIATPLPEPVLLGRLNDAITSLTSSETMILITSQSGQVLLLDISSYFQPEKKPAETATVFSTRLLCAELLQPGSISYVTRLGSALCGSDFLLPGLNWHFDLCHGHKRPSCHRLFQITTLLSTCNMSFTKEKRHQHSSHVCQCPRIKYVRCTLCALLERSKRPFLFVACKSFPIRHSLFPIISKLEMGISVD